MMVLITSINPESTATWGCASRPRAKASSSPGSATPPVGFPGLFTMSSRVSGRSAAATASQWLLEQAGLLHTMLMWSTSAVLSGIFLVAAGLYQLTPLKDVCLKHCRSPLHFLMHGFRTGASGAFRMGVEHGLYCVGCCWVLMVLLFVGGTMNLVWIAGLAIFVLIEKIAPQGIWFGRISGGVLVAAGAYLLFAQT